MAPRSGLSQAGGSWCLMIRRIVVPLLATELHQKPGQTFLTHGVLSIGNQESKTGNVPGLTRFSLLFSRQRLMV